MRRAVARAKTRPTSYRSARRGAGAVTGRVRSRVVELMAAQCRTDGTNWRGRGRRAGAIAKRELVGHARAGGQDACHCGVIKSFREPEQTSAFGPDRDTRTDVRAHVTEQFTIFAERLRVDLRESAAGDQAVAVRGKGAVGAWIERDEFGARRGERCKVLLVHEAERGTTGNGDAHRRDVAGSLGWINRSGCCGLCQCHQCLEVAAPLDGRGDVIERAGDLGGLFDHGDESEMPVPPGHVRVATQRSDHRYSEGFDRGAQHLFVAVAPDTVEDDGRDVGARIERRVSMNDSRNRVAHRGGIDHQHHGCIEQLRDIGR